MASKIVLAVLFLACGASATYKVCVPSTQQTLCQTLDKGTNEVICESVESRVDCALKLARGEADLGLFSEEELLLLRQQQPTSHQVVASVKNVARTDAFAFESVAVVPSTHTGGLSGLQGGKYCHPGLDQTDLRWSPRVLKTLEQKAVSTDRCNEADTHDRTAEYMEVSALSRFFSAGCRPGLWASNSSVDATLKSEFSSLCSICGPNAANSTCSGYTYDMGVQTAGVDNNNRHVQALECLRVNGAQTVAYVAWQHVREYFLNKAAAAATSYAVLCEDGTLRPLTVEVLNNQTAPCAFVKQPWPAIVATTSRASAILTSLKSWWPNGLRPSTNDWQAILFDYLVGGIALKAEFQDGLPTPANYTSGRILTDIDSTTACMPARRWCTTSTDEYTKCSWVRRAAYTLGLEPLINCRQVTDVFQCLRDISEQNADFISLDSNYGYFARSNFNLSPVKLLQNSRSNSLALSRVAAVIREGTVSSNVTRFEEMRDKRACFPEFGGIAYMAFVRAAHDRSIISASECDYARAVGEFFVGACAPGALDISHFIGKSTYNATNLCTSCRATTTTPTTTTSNLSVSDNALTCAFNSTNLYFGNGGALRCLADTNNNVGFLEIQNITAQLAANNLQASNFRVLCRNNTLAANTGFNVDDACLLALVVDAEVLARRNDPQFASLTSLLDHLDNYFGYNAATSAQLLNIEVFSPFDGKSDLLFKDTAIGLAEPSSSATHEPARNYFELFSHLEGCTSGGVTGFAASNVYSLISIVFVTLVAMVAA